MPTRVNVNGTILEPESARISVLDHGFLYGDAIYEAFRTHGGRAVLFDRHYARLRQAAAELELDVPWSGERLRAEVDRTIAAAGFPGDVLVRVIVTRGAGEDETISPDPTPCRNPTVLIFVMRLEAPAEAAYRDGVAITLSSIRRDPRLASIKTGNLIHQVLGAREARARGAAETVFLTTDGHLSDGARSNIFLVRNGEILTPSVAAGIVRGITRGLAVEAAHAAGLSVIEGEFPPDLLEAADEIFITSTTRGILPVTRVDGRPVGGGTVGPVTTRMIEGYRAAIRQLVAAEVRA